MYTGFIIDSLFSLEEINFLPRPNTPPILEEISISPFKNEREPDSNLTEELFNRILTCLNLTLLSFIYLNATADSKELPPFSIGYSRISKREWQYSPKACIDRVINSNFE